MKTVATALLIFLSAASVSAEAPNLETADLLQGEKGGQPGPGFERKFILRPHFGLAIKNTEFKSGHDWEVESYVRSGWGADLGVSVSNRIAVFAGFMGVDTKEDWRSEYTISIHDGPSYTETIVNSNHSFDHFLHGTVRYNIIQSHSSPFVQLGLMYHLERVVDNRFGVSAAVGTNLSVSKSVRIGIEVRMIYAEASPGTSGLEHESLNSIYLTISPEVELFSY